MLNLLRISIGLVLVFCIFSPAETQSNYCGKQLCNNNNRKFKAACTPSAKIIKIGAKLRRAILNKHNGYRNRVARGLVKHLKPARRMATMRWGKELAKLAALNVKQCAMKHDKCRNTRYFRLAGQNLAMGGTGGQSVSRVAMKHIRLWFNEHKNTKMSDINKMRRRRLKKIGHFIAMVQEKNTHVGCAILRQSKSGSTYQYMACNYVYTNIFGKAVYRKGRTASKCRTGRNRRFKGLCSVRERYSANKAS